MAASVSINGLIFRKKKRINLTIICLSKGTSWVMRNCKMSWTEKSKSMLTGSSCGFPFKPSVWSCRVSWVEGRCGTAMLLPSMPDDFGDISVTKAIYNSPTNLWEFMLLSEVIFKSMTSPDDTGQVDLDQKKYTETIWRRIVHQKSIYIYSPTNVLWIYASF